MSDAPASGNLSIRIFQWSCVGLAILGVILLVIAGQGLGVPQVQSIGDLGVTMNMAYVRVQGQVVAGPRYDPESSYLSFTIADESGEMFVTSYRAQTEALIAADKVPQLGDNVVIEGNLRLREETASLNIAAAERCEVQRQPAQPREIASISSADADQRVQLTGVVRNVRQPYAGLNIYTLRDASGQIEVAVSNNLALLAGGLPAVNIGDTVQLSGLVTLYRDTPQITVTDGNAIELQDAAIALAPASQTGAVISHNAGELLQVQGLMGEVQPFSAGMKLSLDDGSGAVTVLLWQDVYDELVKQGALENGQALQVVGEVSLYKGAAELIPASVQDITRLTEFTPAADSAPLPSPSAPAVADAPVSIATALANSGQKVILQATVSRSESYAGGFKFLLQDETGEIVLLLPEDVYSGIAGVAGLRAGAVVLAQGQVGEYKGELQLEPASAADVQVITPMPANTEASTAIGDIAIGDLEKQVTVVGKITKLSEFSAGQRITLQDGSGSIVVIVWSNVWAFVPDHQQFAVGDELHVTGLVGEYQGTLQIVPQIGYDVVPAQAGE